MHFLILIIEINVTKIKKEIQPLIISRRAEFLFEFKISIYKFFNYFNYL